MANFIRVSLQGLLPANEVWSINPSYAAIVGSFTATPEQMNAAATAVAAVTPNSALMQGPSSLGSFTKVRLEARDINGALEGVGEAIRAAPLAGNGTAGMPLQTSMCVSLRTPFPGASNRGRLYWPALAYSFQSGTVRFGSTSVSAVATGMVTYLGAIGAAIKANIPGPDAFQLSVYSGTKHTLRGVTALQVGDVPDTQRRRRDSVPETYTTAAFPPA